MTQATGPIRVFMVDDHELILRGLREAIAEEPDIEVAGEASSVAEALDRVGQRSCDVAVLDFRLPDGDGIELCREIRSRYPHISCLLFTSFIDDQAVLEAVVAGAAGLVLKDSRIDDLLQAIRSTAAGKSLLDQSTVAQVLDRVRGGSSDARLAKLTEQETKVFALIGEGLTNREIAERLFIAEQTVKNYVSSLLKKLGFSRRTQAALLASEVERDRRSR